MSPTVPRQVDLADISCARRVVVKIGSSSLTDDAGRLDVDRLTALVDVLAARRAAGGEVVLVSSGAIAAALPILGLSSRPRDLAGAQAAASVGQGLLIARYTRAFLTHGLRVGQVLLTAEDVTRRSHYKNAQRALTKLLSLGVVPIVNENDTVATRELRFGDNDRLAALVSHLSGADALVLLTDVDALYDGPPKRSGTRRIPYVGDPAEIAGVEITTRGSAAGTGGMVTKVEAAGIASAAGVPVVLTSAENAEAALAGQDVGTWFAPAVRRVRTRRLWIAHAADAQGRLTLDDGAVRAITTGKKSLLAAGVVAVSGEFETGDPVELGNLRGAVVARGLVAYSSEELPERLGRTSEQLRAAFGNGHDREVVHRDDLVVFRRWRADAPGQAVWAEPVSPSPIDSVSSASPPSSVGSVDAADLMGAADSVTPVDAARAVGSAGSVSSVDPVDSADPVGSAGSVSSVDPVDSADPVSSADSVGSTDRPA